MNVDSATEIIEVLMREVLAEDQIEIEFDKNMPLIGGASALDSMKLVELCLALEDKANDIGFDFDWTSEAAMSKSRSMFRSVSTLAEEFVQQYDAQQ